MRFLLATPFVSTSLLRRTVCRMSYYKASKGLIHPYANREKIHTLLPQSIFFRLILLPSRTCRGDLLSGSRSRGSGLWANINHMRVRGGCTAAHTILRSDRDLPGELWRRRRGRLPGGDLSILSICTVHVRN